MQKAVDDLSNLFETNFDQYLNIKMAINIPQSIHSFSCLAVRLEVVFVCVKNKLLKAFVRGMVIPVRIISCLKSTRRRFHSLVSGVEILIVENPLFTRSAITMPLNIPSYCGDESTFYSFILPHIRLINVFCFLMQPRNWFFSLQLIFYFRLYLDA